ncbi:MAG: hypothetical protein LUG66_06355 [Clostridiales bacterium]|nr:hypothetical protein [Clostridiales bacterium]
MNNKFKRALSSILAFVMVISVLTVMNVSSVFAAETFYASLSAADVATGTYSEETEINDYFSIMASSSSTVAVDSSGSKSFTTADGISRSMTYRIKTGGTGSTSARSIKVTPTSNSTLYVYATSSGDATRTLNLLDSSGSTVDSNDSIVSSSITEATFDVEAGKTYYLASASGGINFYYFGLVETAATTYNTVTISGAPDGYVVGQGTDVMTATDTDTYSLAVGSSYTVWANGYTPCYFTVASDTTTVDASSMTEANVYFDYFQNMNTSETGDDAQTTDLYYNYNYTSDMWNLYDTDTTDTSSSARLYFGLNNASDLNSAIITGSFTPSTQNNSWRLITVSLSGDNVDSKSIAVRTDSKSYKLYDGTTLYAPETTVDNSANTEVEYELAFDFENGTASLSLNGGTAVSCDIGTGYSEIKNIYTQTAGTAARNVYMTTPVASFTYGSSQQYVYFGVSKDNAENYSSFYIVDKSNETKIEGSDGNEVYTGVTVNGITTDVADLILQGTGGSDYVVGYVVKVTSGNDVSNLDIRFE